MDRDIAQGIAFLVTVALFGIGVSVWVGEPAWALLADLITVGLVGFAVWWGLTRLFMWLFK